MTDRVARDVLLFCMALVAIAVAFRLLADGITQLQQPDPKGPFTIPTVVVPDTGDPIEITPLTPRLTRAA